jgi:hypothetical protein
LAFSINEILANFGFDGARPTQYMVQIINPANSVADVKVPFRVEAASLPPWTIGNIQVPFFGRKVNIAGDRVFDPWTVTIREDEDYQIRNALEEWQNKINTVEGNLRAFGTASPLAYKSSAIVNQFGKKGNIVRTYNLQGIYPINIGAIELGWGNTDQYETYQVTFAVDWMNPTGATGNAGGT